MATNVSDIIASTDLGGGLIPTQYVTDIIQGAPQSSVLLSRARRVQMSTRTRTQPVLDSLPLAYWVNGDNGLKQTTKMKWTGLNITAEELAVIVAIPDAVIADSSIDLWGEVTPRISAAIGLAFDQAGIFGVNKPASFPTDIVAGATAANNTVTAGTGADLADDIAAMSEMLAEEGYIVNGYASQPGLEWKLRRLRASDGTPIYVQNLNGGPESGIYGYPVSEVRNGAWDTEKAMMIAADWTNFVVGIRQDITYKWLDQAVISDDNGKVILNLAQQDCTAMRVVFRAGFQIANPINSVQPDAESRYPAAVLLPKE